MMEECTHLISAKLTPSAYKVYEKAKNKRQGSRMLSNAIVYYHGARGKEQELAGMAKEIKILQGYVTEFREKLEELENEGV